MMTFDLSRCASLKRALLLSNQVKTRRRGVVWWAEYLVRSLSQDNVGLSNSSSAPVRNDVD